MPCFSIRSKLLSEEMETRLEGAICQGWLTKSPPEKKMPGPRRIFPSKWRRRYFVLRMPPAASTLPGSCGILEYYDSAQCTKKKGSIDLDQCEQVTISLDTYDYRNLFALQSKHKGRSRTYYLAAENETAMNHWVECLCKVCGFKPEDDRPDEDWPSGLAPQPNTYTPQLPTAEWNTRRPDILPDHEPPIVAPHPQSTHRAAGLTDLNVVPPAPVRPDMARTRLNSTDSIPEEPAPEPPRKGDPRLEPAGGAQEAGVYDHPSKSYQQQPAVPHQNPDTTYQVPPHPTPVSGIAKMTHSEDMLINVPPAQPSGTVVTRNSTTSSDNSRVPSKARVVASSVDETYDPVPRPRRYSGERLAKDSQHEVRSNRRPTGHKSSSDTPNLNDQVPAPPNLNSQQQYINIPPNSAAAQYANLDSHAAVGPRAHHHVASSSTSVSAVSGVMEPEYDVPPPPRTDNLIHKSPPPPPHGIQQKPYVNFPTNIRANVLVPPPPLSEQDDSYTPMNGSMRSGQKTDSYMPMTPCADQQDYMPMSPESGGGSIYRQKDTYLPMSQQQQQQRPDSDLYMPMSAAGNRDTYTPMDRSSVSSLYTPMTSVPPAEHAPPVPNTDIYQVPPSPKPVPVIPPRTTASSDPPRLQPHTSNPSTNISDGVFQQSRTKSFKRIPSRPAAADPPLPMKKSTASTGDSSSSEDDDDSVSSLDRSSDTLPSTKPHHTQKVEMLSKKSLNSTPPPPKRPGEVQYLDLALDKGLESERSPDFPRSPPPPASRHGNASPTEYKEIDFVKTKALTDMKKDVESKRKSSEKSVDE